MEQDGFESAPCHRTSAAKQQSPHRWNDYVRIILISTLIVCMQMHIPKVGSFKSAP